MIKIYIKETTASFIDQEDETKQDEGEKKKKKHCYQCTNKNGMASHKIIPHLKVVSFPILKQTLDLSRKCRA